MPHLLEIARSLGYQGLSGLLEFTNDDGALPRYNCGQAAVATLLSFVDRRERAETLMDWLESEHPPDNLGGWLGTSRRRVERGLRSRGYRPRAIHGEGRLRGTLAAGVPVILTVQISVGTFWKWNIPSAHWMVAFGFDEENVFLTNWWDNKMPWPEFLKGWHGWVPALTCMRATGLIATPVKA